MSYSSEKISKRGARTSSISTVIGISLVLFMLGSLGLILLNAKKLSDYVKENIQVQVFFNENVTNEEALQFEEMLKQRKFTRRTDFISKELAAENLKADLGEDFITFLGYNPLSSSIDLFLNSEYSDSKKISGIVEELKRDTKIKEVIYSPDLIDQLNENIEKLAYIMLGFSALLLVISIALINNTIRLAIFSKRFLIKTMQLVGATPGFIRRPFLIQGTLQGLFASIIAMALIGALVYFAENRIPGFFELKDVVIFAKIFGGVILLGIFIAWISTFFAVRKYIRLKSDDLF